MQTTDDVLRWAHAQLKSVRHDLDLLDRGLDAANPEETHTSPLSPHGVARLFLEGQEGVLARLIHGLTGTALTPRARKPAWTPRDGEAQKTVDWWREGVRIRDEQGAPHNERWAITAPLPDGRRVTTNYATTLAEAMEKGDEDVEAMEKVEVALGYGKKREKHIDDQSACVSDVVCPDSHYVENNSAVERRRGHTDAVAGHGPAMFDGSYMIGYRRGRAEIGRPMEHKSASENT